MILKAYILLFIFLSGVFVLPTQAEACCTKSGKGECAIGKSQTKTTDDGCCCDSHTTKKGKKGCDNKCDYSDCRCVTIISILTSGKQDEILLNCFNFSNKKETFYLHTADLASGFYTIWSPPKIS